MSTPSGKPQGAPGSSSVSSGADSLPEKEDEKERARTTDQRWQAVFTSALIQKHPDELDQAMANPDSHEPIEIPH